MGGTKLINIEPKPKYAPLFASILKHHYEVENRKVDSSPSPNIHIFLPSGVAVIGIDFWVERFTKIFQNIGQDQEVHSANPVIVKTRSQPPNVIPFQYSEVTNVNYQS